MLRAYFSRVCNELPPVAELGPDFDDIDGAPWQPEIKLASVEEKKALRTKARNTIAHIAEATVGKPVERTETQELAGHGLCHAGKRADPCLFPHVSWAKDPEMSSKEDFARRVEEREFPTCPPKRLDSDGLLAFYNPKTEDQEDPQWRAVRVDPMDQHLFSAASDFLGRRDRRRAVADLRISYRGYRGVDPNGRRRRLFHPHSLLGR